MAHEFSWKTFHILASSRSRVRLVFVPCANMDFARHRAMCYPRRGGNVGNVLRVQNGGVRGGTNTQHSRDLHRRLG